MTNERTWFINNRSIFAIRKTLHEFKTRRSDDIILKERHDLYRDAFDRLTFSFSSNGAREIRQNEKKRMIPKERGTIRYGRI